MKNLIFILVNVVTTSLCAQNHVVIEPSVLECQYNYQVVSDTLSHRIRNDMMILRIGNTCSQFFSSNTLSIDSLLNTPEGQALWGRMMVENIRKHNLDNLPTKKTEEYIYKNYPQGKITIRDHLLLDSFVYGEDYEPQHWEIADSTCQILNYACQLAICDFRGRKYFAWFASDIPVREGPWKFNGLPGLIMKVYDQEKQYQYEIVGLKSTNLSPVTLYEFEKYGKFQKTDRIKFLQAKRKIMNTPSTIKASTGIDLGGGNRSETKRSAYEFLEKDYY